MTKDSIIFNSKIFKKWRKKFNPVDAIITSIDLKFVISRTIKTFYLAVLDVNLKKKNTDISFPRCLILRGDTVIIVPILKCKDDGQIYTILVEQFRIIDGGLSLEFPAGMIDYDIGPKASAIIECKEELNIDINDQDLIPLSNSPFKVCESLMDENVYVYGIKFEMKKDHIYKYDGLKTGDIKQNEFITLKVLKFSEVEKIKSFSTYVAYNLVKNNQLI
jgi:8-oxo-dGTP pyrophosphatase MutT (NUDIX family)